MNRESFVFYRSFAEALAALEPETRLNCYDAITDYALNGGEIELSGVELAVFKLIKPQIDANNRRYQNGTKGGRPKTEIKPNNNQNKTKMKPNQNQTETKQEPNVNVNVNVNDNDKDINSLHKVVNMYNEICISFPKVTRISEQRKKAINARLKKYTVDDLKRAFELAEQSDFLKGSNNRNWSASFDWLMNDTNIAKVLDGNYINKTQKIQIDSNFRNFLEENQVIDWGAKDGNLS